MTAHPRGLLAERREAPKHCIDECAVFLEVGAPLVGDGVELLGPLGLGGEIARLLEVGEGRVHDPGARRVPAGGLLLQHLDDLVAVARLLGDERQRDQAQIALRQHPPRPHHVAESASATAPMAPAPAGPERPAPAPMGAPLLFDLLLEVSHPEHVFALLGKFDISLDKTDFDVAQDISSRPI